MTGFDERSKQFYSRIFNSAILNWRAVELGYFDVCFCQTDDPLVMLRWKEAVPAIVARLRLDNLKE